MKNTKITVLLAFASMLVIGNATASELTYLSCEISNKDGSEVRHFDFTLDEANSTVAFYVQGADETNVAKAVFSPETVTWTYTSKYFKLIRIISRIDLKFTEIFGVDDDRSISVGTWTLQTPKGTKF